MAARALYGKQRQALPQHRRLFRIRKTARKPQKNTRISVKTAIVLAHNESISRIVIVSVEKQSREPSNGSPWHPSQGSAAI